MIHLAGIRKAFGKTVAVDGLSLDVHAGEVFGLLGPNGAGKTTTISIATGLLAPDTGTVRIGTGPNAGSPRAPRVRATLGVAPQSIALYDELTGRENLSFFARLYGLTGPARRTAVDRCLGRVGLADRAADRVAGYSGGMKRRLNLAAALIHTPRLLFLDEPTAGVDPQSRHALIQIVAELKDMGVTIVYSTHYMEEAERMCDRIAIVDHGKVLAVGTVADLIAQHGGDSIVEVVTGRGDHAQVQRTPAADPLSVLAPALAAGSVTSARVYGPTLESAFLTLTGRSLRD
jgi:ABC-2 type transport system ATP-binding protein